MEALPWLVADGVVVWRAGLLACVSAGAGVAALRPRIAAWRAARRARAALGEPHRGALEGGARVTLSGVLLAKDERVARYEDGGEAAAASVGREPGVRAAQLAVLVGDTVITLEGPIAVVAGSRESWPGRAGAKLAAAVRERAGADLDAQHAPVFRSVAPGDRVRVTGVLREEAAEDGTTYRDAAKRWTLSGEGAPIALAAERAPRVTGPSRAAMVTPTLYGVAAFLAVFGLGGEAAMTVARSPAPALDAEVALSLAAATPFRRDDALAALLVTLDAQHTPDPEVLRVRDRLHAMRGEQVERAAMWIAQGDPERGAALAAGAGRPDLAAHAYYAVGDFTRAEEAWRRFHAPVRVPEQRFSVGLELLAGDLDHAAAAARLLAQALREAPAANDAQIAFNAQRADTALCLAFALDARRNVASGWVGINARATGRTSLGCAVLRIDLLEGSRRVEAVDALRREDLTREDVPRAWASLLAAEADRDRSRTGLALHLDPTYDVAVPNGGFLAEGLPAVDRAIAEDLAKRGPTPSDGDLLARAALFASLTGDDEAARRFEAAFPRGNALLDADLREALGLPEPPALAELPYRGPLLAYRRNADPEPLLRLLVRRPPPDEDEKRAWALAAAGDGEGLATWMGQPVSQPGTFLRFGAPHVKRGREALLRTLRWAYRPPTEGFWPTEHAVHLVNLAAAEEALGWEHSPRRGHAARFREALLRRETAVPLAILERL
jgi:hypothetical protein